MPASDKLASYSTPSQSNTPHSKTQASTPRDLSPKHHESWWHDVRQDRALLRGKVYYSCKRLFDLFLIAVSFPFIFFIVIICALLIKIESPEGPILFKQRRTGKDGRRFTMYKFRTMVPNAEEIKKQLAAQNELQWPDFKITRDPRVTRVGRFLRRSSLDELPQIYNILIGDMSFVGPRPTSFPADTYEPWQKARLAAVPGLTGLWQIIGRGEMEFDERSKLDIAYIERQCFSLDLKIILRTIFAVLGQKGAV